MPLDPGFLPGKLASDQTRRLDSLAERVEISRWGAARLGARQHIVLQPVSEDAPPFTLPLSKERFVLGRFDNEAGIAPDIDLSRFDAREKGVSRRHAELVIDDDLLKVVDLNSSNATYVNGQRLVAYQSRILQDGDELRLGHLVLSIHFVE
ncbi:MAG: FHA domain-containing protein [Anaerolineae bacterium]|nr:FHA domain-containing protein [Anaerolineae bacterium]